MLLVLVSDESLLFIYAFPLLIVLATKVFRSREYVKATLLLFITLIAYPLILEFLQTTPYFHIQAANTSVATGQRLMKNFFLTVHGIISYLPGLPVQWSIFSVIELGFFFVGVYGLFLLFKAYYKKNNILPSLLILCFIFTLAAYLFSTQPSDLTTSRYLIFIFFLLPLGICYCISKLSKNLLSLGFCVCLIICSLVNFIYINFTFYQIGKSQPYQQNNIIINTVQKYGLNYGYTSYWNAAINTYLSGNKIKFRQILCTHHYVYPYFWLSSDRWYEVNKEITKNFILIDFTGNLTPELKGCSLSDITRQFGKPDKIESILTNKGNFSLLLYNHNIASEL